MRRLAAAATLVLALALAGCNGERRRVSREANALTAAFTVKMDKGETNRDQEQRFIRAMSKVSYELDRSIRGSKKAKKTRDAANKLAAGGLDPDSNLNLDDTRGTDGASSESILKGIEKTTEDIEKAVDEKIKGDKDNGE